MSKRELRQITGPSEAEGSRPKRRRETAGVSSDVDATHSDPMSPGLQVKEEGNSANEEAVKEQGLKLWQTVKDAVNKECVASCLIRLFSALVGPSILTPLLLTHGSNRGRNISVDFLRKPSKRQYADYYQFIQKPIALDDIKKQLDHGNYASLEAVKQDFELCFNNAKQYNMKDSPIWKDAKDLLVCSQPLIQLEWLAHMRFSPSFVYFAIKKIVHKTYNKLVPPDDDDENGDADGEKKGKSKAPNLNRLIKSRLQKLVARTDSK